MPAKIRTRKNGRRYPIRAKKSYGYLDVAPDRGLEHRHSVSHHLGRDRIEEDRQSFGHILVSEHRKQLGKIEQGRVRKLDKKQRELEKKDPYTLDFLGEDQLGQFF